MKCQILITIVLAKYVAFPSSFKLNFDHIYNYILEETPTSRYTATNKSTRNNSGRTRFEII